MKSGSLSRRIAGLTTIGISVALLLAIIVAAAVLREEADEQRDDVLRELAPFASAVLTDLTGQPDKLDDFVNGGVISTLGGHEPFFGIGMVATDGTVLLSWQLPGELPDPQQIGTDTFWQSDTHRFYIGHPDKNDHVVILGDSLEERSEAFSESLVAFVGPMLPLLLIAFLLVRWISRTALRPLDDLRSEIAQRDRGALNPIDGSRMPLELRPMVTTLNSFMSRLLTALDAERQFAANAAHELRTPLALALARLQRIEADKSGANPKQIAELRGAIKRMTQTVERLLQLSRAETGPEQNGQSCDIAEVLGLLVHDRTIPPNEDRIALRLPENPVQARIGADDFAIIASNLLDNALRYAPPDTQIKVSLDANGTLSIANSGALIPADELPGLMARHKRRDTRGGGLGLGLYIAKTLTQKSGGSLRLYSPIRGHADGVEAILKFPCE
ncbi:MAG: hypothetical protein GYB25_08260 [Rhodobacteraceae bacterium]|nr:hypothetical protein [Paracoccaceae bacterium]